MLHPLVIVDIAQNYSKNETPYWWVSSEIKRFLGENNSTINYYRFKTYYDNGDWHSLLTFLQDLK